jgi:hypothetical protein
MSCFLQKAKQTWVRLVSESSEKTELRTAITPQRSGRERQKRGVLLPESCDVRGDEVRALPAVDIEARSGEEVALHGQLVVGEHHAGRVAWAVQEEQAGAEV